MKRSLLSITLLLISAFAMHAANFSGKWAIPQAPGRGFFGRGGPTVLTLNHVGAEVSGTISTRADMGSGSPISTEILGGKVEGDKISFYVWTGSDQPQKSFYKGTLSSSGDEIAFTVTGAPASATPGPAGSNAQNASRELIAKRTK